MYNRKRKKGWLKSINSKHDTYKHQVGTEMSLYHATNI